MKSLQRSAGRSYTRELERARMVRDSYHSRSSALGGFGGIADRLNEYNHYLGTRTISRRILRAPERDRRVDPRVRPGAIEANARVVVYGIPGKPDLGPDVPTPKTQQKGKSTAGSVTRKRMACERAAGGRAPQLNLPVRKFSSSRMA